MILETKLQLYEHEPFEDRVLVLAPTGRDSELLVATLRRAGLSAHPCRSTKELCDLIEEGAGAVIVAEEALDQTALSEVAGTLRKQPHWSDLPLILLSHSASDALESSWQTISVVDSIRNVALLERPIHELTMVSAARVALRSRAHQYEMRDHLRNLNATEAALRDREAELSRQTEELEIRVKDRTKELVEAIKELEGFTYSIAHDLRSPLRRLLFSSEIIQSDYTECLDEEGKDTLKQIGAEARKLTLLVDDLLTYARLGQHSVAPQEIDLSTMAAKVALDLLDGEAIELNIQPGMRVKGDPVMIELVLQNLIDNASKYRSRSRPAVVSIGYDDQESAFFVSDNGIGFDMNYAGKVFKAFERLHRDAEYPGSGIGLANVKRIVERHGGSVWVKSEPAKGSTFYFTLGLT